MAGIGGTTVLAAHPIPEAPAREATGFGPWLALWVALTVMIQGGLWIAGFRSRDLTEAVDAGAARTEVMGLGVVGDDLIRKAIRTQHETLRFWTVLALSSDFVGEPIALLIRTLGAATAFGALAALSGRRVGFEAGLSGCAAAQGYWVLGMAVRAGLMAALRRGDVETSAALLLPAGVYPAVVWLGARQVEVFGMVGWWAVGSGGVRRGQVGVFGALMVAASIWVVEAVFRVGLGTLLGSAARLSIMPG